uniref:ER lumen protein-retaining receptor n=1 Tax=Lynx canadensis TaxID=61383 RepID=A0A667HLQ6_LYNCA
VSVSLSGSPLKPVAGVCVCVAGGCLSGEPLVPSSLGHLQTPPSTPTLKPRQKHTHTHAHTHDLTSLGFPPSTPPELEEGDTHTHTHTHARARARAHAGVHWGPGCHCRPGLFGQTGGHRQLGTPDARPDAGRRLRIQGFQGEPGPVCSGVHGPLPGPLHQLHLPVQHVHEGGLHCLFLHHSLDDLQQVQSHVRRQPRHVQGGVPRCSHGHPGVLVNHDFTPLEILWTFSIYLESVAILPQLFMVSKTGRRRPSPATTCSPWVSTAPSISSTGSGANHFEGFFDLIAIVAGLVQTVLYCDFFYLYITKVLKGKKLSLPA